MPKTVTVRGVTVTQGIEPMQALAQGLFLGLLMTARHGETVTFYRWKQKTYAMLYGSPSEEMLTMLEALEDGEVFTNILAVEIPSENQYPPGSTAERTQHVRFDLLID